MNSMYEILMSLPLMKGVSHERISQIAEMAKLHFLKYTEGERIVTAGEPCTHIKFIITGSVRATITNRDGRFRVSQTITAPDVLSPDFLFGRHTIYPADVVSRETTGILQIAKTDYITILNTDSVFLFNFLNLLSTNAQKAVDGMLAVTEGSLTERIAFWIISLTQPGSTDIVLSCRQRDLYSLFGVQRSSFTATMESMKADGLIDFNSHEIIIKSRKRLLSVLNSPE